MPENPHEYTADTRITFVATAYVDVGDLTEEQVARLKHHAEISRRLFAKSIAGMDKGVRKYPPEPGLDGNANGGFYPVEGSVMRHYLPHIFEEQIDGANDTGLAADALGVEL